MDSHHAPLPVDKASVLLSVKALEDELVHIKKQIDIYQQAERNVEARIKFLTAGNSNKKRSDFLLYTKAADLYGTKGDKHRAGTLLNTFGFKSGNLIRLYNVWVPQKSDQKNNKKYFQQVDGVVIGTTKDYCWIVIDTLDTDPFKKKNKYVVKKE